jgi:hypothetical protein
MKVRIEISKFVRQNVSIREEVKMIPAKFFLHGDDIFAKAIFSSYLIGVWKVVYFLKFV